MGVTDQTKYEGGGPERERGWEGKGGEAFILCQFVLIEALSNVKYQFEIIFASEWGEGGIQSEGNIERGRGKI